MNTYQTRVLEEKRALDEKIAKLSTYVNTEMYDNLIVDERLRLTKQLEAMHTYSNILNERINSFPVL